MDFTRPGVSDLPLPTSIGEIFKIKIQFTCDEGKFCDNVDAMIRGCAQGNVNQSHCLFLSVHFKVNYYLAYSFSEMQTFY